MPRTSTLSELRTYVQRRGSYENSSDITDAILNDFINEAISETYDLLVQRWADYYITRGTLVTVAGTDTVALPTTFYKLRKLEVVDDASPSGYRRLTPVDLEVSHTLGAQVTAKHYRYRIEAGNLVLMPTPTVVESLRLFYIPYATKLSADGDTFDGINGYEELAVQFALLRCKMREELPTDDIEREIARLTVRVRSAGDGRDASSPMYFNPYGSPDGDDDWWY